MVVSVCGNASTAKSPGHVHYESRHGKTFRTWGNVGRQTAGKLWRVFNDEHQEGAHGNVGLQARGVMAAAACRCACACPRAADNADLVTRCHAPLGSCRA